MNREELITFMLGTGEYSTVKEADRAIMNKMAELKRSGMSQKNAWESMVEFMELTLTPKTNLFETREQAMQGCLAESDVCARFSEKAIELFRQGKITEGFEWYELAKTASVCAMQAHEALWKMAKGELTEDEQRAFETAENAVGKLFTARFVLKEESKKVGF